MKRYCLLLVSALILLPTDVGVAAAADPSPLVLQLPNLDGKAEWLTNHKGKVVLLNFWYTSCPPCRIEIPWFVEFQERWEKQGFTVIGVSMLDTPDQIRVFNKRFGVNYPMMVGIDAEDAIEKATGGMWAMPTSYVIGRDGKVIKKHVGLVPREVLEKEIARALLAPW